MYTAGWECWLRLKAGLLGDAIGIRLVIDESWLQWMEHTFADTTID